MIAVSLAISLLGAPSPKVLSASVQAGLLSQELNVPVKVEKPLDRLTVFLDRHQTSANVGLEALANCLHATLSKGSAGYLIARTPTNLSKLHARIAADHADWLTTSFARDDQFRKAMGWAQDRYVQFWQVISQEEKDVAEFWAHRRLESPDLSRGTTLLPAALYLEKLSECIGINRMACVLDNVHLVFEDDPVLGACALPDHRDLDEEFAQAMRPFASHPLSATSSNQGFFTTAVV